MTPEKGIEQADVMRRWHEQLELPESERDILESRTHKLNKLDEWTISFSPAWNFLVSEYRLRKRPRKKTVTVYLHRKGTLTFASLLSDATNTLLGQADITYEETDDDTR